VVAHDAAKAMQRYRDKASAVQIRDDVQELEHKGDAIVHEMLDALARTFVTPIDREDLQRLSKRLDDILDYTNLAARACVLFGVDQPTKPMLLLIDKLVQCTEVLKDAVPKLRKRAYNQLIEASHTLHNLEKEGDVVFRDAVSALFHDPAIDAKVILREKEVLDDLEKAINRCDSTAETIINVAVKHA
jgi:predicted phosphate transport protein (TIGR00153 family)